MINIDFLTLKAFFIENIDFFINARVQKIQQPTRKDFIFTLRNYSESRKLYININPEIYHIAFMSSENEKKRYLAIPKKPPMFCMLLRKYLEGCKIEDALVVKNERIIEFHFEITDELAQMRSLCLCIELMGKHSNIILYDRKTDIIIGCAHNVGAEKSRYRELKGGLKYISPPTKSKSELTLSKELQNQFQNLSDNQIQAYLCTESFRPAIKNERYTLFAELLTDSKPKSSVNSMLDEYYANIQEQKLLQSEKHTLRTIVNTKISKTEHSLKKAEDVYFEKQDFDKYRIYGELITANIYNIKSGQTFATVFNYNTGNDIRIELDSSQTPAENAQMYFKLYSKNKKSAEKSAEIINNLNIQKKYLKEVLYSIDNSSTLTDFQDIKSELGINAEEKKSDRKNEILKTIINGFDVYIGKNNKQNDYIVSKIGKDEDYWFHIKTYAGSHVLLKTENREPDEKTLFECCKLAKKYSSAQLPSKVSVVYTRKKYVKKPSAAPLGYVIFKNEKEVLV